MLSYLTTLGLSRFLTETPLEFKDSENDVQIASAVDAWKDCDFLCKKFVLNGLDGSLYNAYNKLEMAKEVWKSLSTKYNTEDAGTKKFIVGRFLNYMMADSKPVLNQVEQLLAIFKEIHNEGMIVSEDFQVAAIIHLLPPAWKDFKTYLMYKRERDELGKVDSPAKK